MAQTKPTREGGSVITEQQMQTIQKLARTLRYGTLTLVFQDGALLQIDRNEKIRLPREEA